MKTFWPDMQRPRRWGLIAPLTLLIAMTGACSNNDVSRIHIKLVDRPQDKTPPASKPPEPLKCPSTDIQPLDPSAPQTGHHKVFLTWDATKPTKAVPGEAAGYCLYRSTTKDAAKKNPNCPECERINEYPVRGTACVDELVRDGSTYYYVAAAITQNRELSKSSNEIRVVVPAFAQAIGDPPRGVYPSCRALPAGVAPPSSHY
jgi:hypothetical protein